MRLALLVATERGAQERGGRAYTLRVHVLTAFQRPPIYLPPSPGAPRSPRPNDRGCWPRARTTRLRTTRSDTTTTSNTRPTSLSSRAPGKAFGRLLFHIHVYIIARSFKASTYPRLSPSLPIQRPCLTCRRHRLYHRLRKQSPRPTKPSWRVSAYRLPRIRASRVAPRESKPKKKFINNLSFLRFCIIVILWKCAPYRQLRARRPSHQGQDGNHEAPGVRLAVLQRLADVPKVLRRDREMRGERMVA